MLHEIQIDYLIQPSRRNRKPTAPLTKAAEEKLKKRKLFECKECDFETYSRSEILAHRTTQRHEIENMGKSSERAKRTKPLGLDPPITCDSCNKQLTTMFMLYQHNRTSGCANKIKPFSCSKCNNYTTDRMNTLHKHEHNHDLAFACKVCGWKTGMKTRLKAHMLSKHADNLANFDDIPLNSFPAAITCHVCNETVNDERKMLEHNLRCSYKVNRLKCFYCLQFSAACTSSLILIIWSKTKKALNWSFCSLTNVALFALRIWSCSSVLLSESTLLAVSLTME